VDKCTGTGLDPMNPPSDATVVLRGLHVKYHVGGRKRPRLKDLFAGRQSDDGTGRVIHAVRGIDLVARRGEAIGFVGRNGSGKSTTLTAVAGLLPATDGEVLSTSEPVLLGVGAALQSNMTGRRNAELGCLALGLTKAQTEERMKSIIEFAGLDEFIDLPLKTYSSGMRARLHFSIATSIEPEILLIDEALAVGDENFRRKSEARIKELLANAGTVFIVSHSLATLVEACSRVVWIDKGVVRMDGDPQEVVDAYLAAS
jgi:teichoic acid transport system ATP-binding protein